MRRILFRKPENDSIVATFEWTQQLTAEGKGWIEEYYWTEPIKRLKARLPFSKRGLIFLTGLQGTGKTAALKMLADKLIEETEKIPPDVMMTKAGPLTRTLYFKWTKDWRERLFNTEEDFSNRYIKYAINEFRLRFPHSDKYDFEIAEKRLSKGIRREVRKNALLDFLVVQKYIFIDMPDYSKTDVRFMTKDLGEIQALWNILISGEKYMATEDYQGVFVIAIQKELHKGQHFIFGKGTTIELPMLKPEELVKAYKLRFESALPFTEKALLLIARLSRGVFRRFIRYCGLTIEEFLLAGKKEPPITVDYAKKAISSRITLEDLRLELYDKFRSDSQRELALAILDFLIKGERANQKELAERLNASEASVSRVTGTLAFYGYVIRERGKRGEALVKLK